MRRKPLTERQIAGRKLADSLYDRAKNDPNDLKHKDAVTCSKELALNFDMPANDIRNKYGFGYDN